MTSVRKYLSLKETAEQLGLSQRTVRRLISGGYLQAYRIPSPRASQSGTIRIRQADIDELLIPIPVAGNIHQLKAAQ